MLFREELAYLRAHSITRLVSHSPGENGELVRLSNTDPPPKLPITLTHTGVGASSDSDTVSVSSTKETIATVVEDNDV